MQPAPSHRSGRSWHDVLLKSADPLSWISCPPPFSRARRGAPAFLPMAPCALPRTQTHTPRPAALRQYRQHWIRERFIRLCPGSAGSGNSRTPAPRTVRGQRQPPGRPPRDGTCARDRAGRGPVLMAGQFELVNDAVGGYRARLTDKTGKVLALSEQYSDTQAAARGIQVIREIAATGLIEDKSGSSSTAHCRGTE